MARQIALTNKWKNFINGIFLDQQQWNHQRCFPLTVQDLQISTYNVDFYVPFETTNTEDIEYIKRKLKNYARVEISTREIRDSKTLACVTRNTYKITCNIDTNPPDFVLYHDREKPKGLLSTLNLCEHFFLLILLFTLFYYLYCYLF